MKETLRAAACEGKERFDRVTAGKVARKSKIPMEAYRCPYCQGYHVGPPPKVKKVKRFTVKL